MVKRVILFKLIDHFITKRENLSIKASGELVLPTLNWILELNTWFLKLEDSADDNHTKFKFFFINELNYLNLSIHNFLKDSYMSQIYRSGLSIFFLLTGNLSQVS